MIYKFTRDENIDQVETYSYTIEANSEAEAIEKLKAGDIVESELIDTNIQSIEVLDETIELVE